MRKMMVITYAIPVFFLFLLIEYLICRRQKNNSYLAIDTLSNLSVGILSRLTGPFTHLFSLGFYVLIYENYRFVTVNDLDGWAFAGVGVLFFLLIDLCYYIEHRAMHRINILWGAHIIHHQSERFNLSVAFRQSSLGVMLTFFFYLPVAILGLSPWWYALFKGLNLLYQFFIHTETVGKLGFLEHFMNTPSHHRVHHGKNPKYIDKNYAGVFIIWDKMFGSFQAEEETPTYGVTTPPDNFNPIVANIHFYPLLWREMKKRPNLLSKIALWFAPPEQITASKKRTSYFHLAYRAKLALPRLLSVSMVFALTTIATFMMLLFVPNISSSTLLILAVLLAIMTELPFRIYINHSVKRKVDRRVRVRRYTHLS